MANLGRLAVAILGVLAYQNRDKIGELLRGNRDPNNPEGGILDQLSKGVPGRRLALSSTASEIREPARRWIHGLAPDPTSRLGQTRSKRQ